VIRGFIEREQPEKIILVSVIKPGYSVRDSELDLSELELLVNTAGATVVEKVVQKKSVMDPATLIGRGKAEDLARLSEKLDVDTIVFDEELNPTQQRNLEKILGRTAIDRTEVILDIFAQNTSSEEGKAQVELAIYNYRLPRLRGKGTELSRLAGGIGTRGPGESKLESDRRQILDKISRLRKELKSLEKTREVQMKKRMRSNMFQVSLVGYTNAGKSSLLNFLSKKEASTVENKLFSTLDPRTRKVYLSLAGEILVSDTVGFIRKLPHELVAAFHSTLESLCYADLLIHVVDPFSGDPERNVEVVNAVLSEIGANDIERMIVVNKADLDLETAKDISKALGAEVYVSAKTGLNMDIFQEKLGSMVQSLKPIRK
jgi:GTP-binding protein HflX